MVEKTTSHKLAEKQLPDKKPASAEENKNAVIQKNKADTHETKKAETNAKFDAKEKNDPALNFSESTFPMTLEEFCTRLSQEKNQVEMIGGFYAHERLTHEKLSEEKSSDGKNNQHLFDTEVSFKTRFDDFCTLPVMS